MLQWTPRIRRRPQPESGGARGPSEEPGFFHSNASDAPGGDEAVAVLHRHAEGESSALDRFEHRIGGHHFTDTNRRQVVELHSVANRGVTSGYVTVDGNHRSLFGEQHDVRRRQDRDRTGPLGERGVGVDDGMSHSSGQTGVERHGRTIRNPWTDTALRR